MGGLAIDLIQHAPKAALLVTLPLLFALIVGVALRKRPSFERSVVWKAAIASALLLPFVSLVGSLAGEAPPARAVVRLSSDPVVPAWIAFAAGLWATVAAVLAARLGIVWFAQRREVRLASPPTGATWEVFASLRSELGAATADLRVAGTRAAYTFGWLRPVVVVPERSAHWTRDAWRFALTHELVHLRRRDYLEQLFAEALCCAWWWNPLVWVARDRAELERERACDEATVARGPAPAAYAEFLLGEATSDAPLAIGTGMGRGSVRQLKRRVVAIVGPSPGLPSPRIASAWAVAAALVAGGGALLPVPDPLSPRRPFAVELPDGRSVLTNSGSFAEQLRRRGRAAMRGLPDARRVDVEMSPAQLEALRRGESVSVPFDPTQPQEENK